MKWRKHRKSVDKYVVPAALTVEIAVSAFEKFMTESQKMEEAIKALAIACAQVSASIDANCEKLNIVYNTTNMSNQQDDK